MKKTKIINKSIAVIMSIILVLSIIIGIILSINLLAKYNKEQLWAETNKIKIGAEEILYVDLTTKSEDYKKINQSNEIEQVSTDNELIVDNSNENAYNSELKSDENKAIIDENDIEVNNPYSTNKILIKTSNIDKINNVENIESIVKISEDLYSIHYSNAKDTKDGYNILKDDNAIENVIKDCKVTALENETSDISLEALDVSSGKSAWGIYDTGLSLLKDKINYTKNIPEIKVAVLDTGLRSTHEVFRNQNTADRLDLTDSYNYISKNKNIADDNGHGTMVAGILSEATSNNVKIVPIKIMDNTGEGSLINVIEAMYAIVNKVDVINLSLGISNDKIDSNSKQIFDKAIKNIYDSGVMIVCASGNEGKENVYYPASSTYTISVGATKRDKEIADFSNYGNTVDFTAPGVGLWLPYYTSDTIYNNDLPNVNNSGTSFASPFITSAIAMIKSENKNYSTSQIKNILIKNTEDLGIKGKDKYYGYGLLNFDIEMFKKPVIVAPEITTTGENGIKIVMHAICGNKITNWSQSNTNIEPNNWRTYSKGSTTVSATLSGYDYNDYYVWFKDEKGNVTGQKVYTAKKSTDTSTNISTNTNNNTNTSTNTTTEPTIDTPSIMYGDLNNNKIIDIGDLLKLKRHIAQANDKSVAQKHPDWKLNNKQISIGDVNSNNIIDIGDILKIQRYIAAQNSKTIRLKHPSWAKLK